MKILFVHQNFPGQYQHLAPAMAAGGHQVFALTEKKSERFAWMKTHNINYAVYEKPEGAGKETHRYLRTYEAQIRRGQAAARSCLNLKRIGFVPDVICAHPGWGEALFLKEVFPEAKIISFCEFYYGEKSTLNFDPEFPEDELDARARLRVMNSPLLSALEACDQGISPTEWQKANHPTTYLDKIKVIFDGVNTEVARPDPGARLKLPDGRELTPANEVISFVNRNLEPYRGWHIFCRALPEILRLRPKAEIIIVGGDEVSYGRKLPDGETYKKKFLEEVKPDLNRIHFVGRVPYPQLVALFQIARVHVYLTYPFVLSWSMLDAMSCGCPVIGSKTPPVEELISDQETGFLTDFFDQQALAEKINNVIENQESSKKIGLQAREHIIKKYDLKTVCLPAQMKLINDLI